MRSPIAVLSLLAAVLLACGSSSEETHCRTTGCAQGEACDAGSGRCEALPACESDAQCKEGEECLSGVCSSCASNILCTTSTERCDPATLECAGCTSDTACGGATPRCSTASGACLECTQDAQCASGTCFRGWCAACELSSDCADGQRCVGGVCQASCAYDTDCPAAAPFCLDRACATCRHDEDCPSGQACSEGACRAPRPADTCRSATVVPFGAGSALVEGTVPVDYEGRYSSPGSSEYLRDVYYAIDVAQEGLLQVALSPRGLSPDVRVEVLTGGCGGLKVMARGARSLTDVYVVPGRYHVRVSEAPYSMLDSFLLRLSLTPGTRTPGQHCLKPAALAVGARGGSEVGLTTSFAGALPQMPDLCDDGRTPGRPDVIYALVLQERSRVEVTARPVNPDDRIDVVLKASCWDPDGTCDVQGQPTASLAKGPLEPGTYHLVVRSRVGGGPVELGVKVLPWATNATCDAAVPLVFDASGTAVVSGNTLASSAGVGGCSGSSGSGVVHYRLSTVGLGARSLSAELVQAQGSGNGVGVHPTCRTTQQSAAYCPGTGLRKVTSLPEGTYDVSVAGGGPFTLTLRLGEAYPPPSNDTCSAAATLALDGQQQFSGGGDTRGATEPFGNVCPSDPLPYTPSRDVAFAVPLPTGFRGRVHAAVQATSAGYNPRLTLAEGCSSSAAQCVESSGGAGAGALRLSVYATQVVLGVGARDGSEGTFTVSGRLEPAPANDACAGAVAVPLATPVSGDIGLAYADNDTWCTPSGTSSGGSLYFTFAAQARASYRVRVVPQGFDAGLSVVDACGGTCPAAGSGGSVNAGGPGVAEELVFTMGNSGATKRIGVFASDSRAEGTFSVEVTQVP